MYKFDMTRIFMFYLHRTMFYLDGLMYQLCGIEATQLERDTVMQLFQFSPAMMCLIFWALPLRAEAQGAPPSIPGADAPQLAALGPDAVGFRTITLVHRYQPDFAAGNPKTGAIPLHDRTLVVDIWYPAKVVPGAVGVTYSAAFWGEPNRPPVRFTVAGLAVRDAKAFGAAHPLVILSHGYSNAPAAMTWLTENLASKGYVVAGIHHEDPDPYIISAEQRSLPTFNRPLDITFVAAQLKEMLGKQIDPGRVALIGYSMGGYGVLTAGGATLDPKGPAMDLVPGGWLKAYARSSKRAADISVPGLKAIVAMAPAGGEPINAWGKDGLAAITSPLLLIAGDTDQVVHYKPGAQSIFADALHADRYLLTYRGAGHAIGLNPAPVEMQHSLWDLDWFNDPVWRPERLNAINLHFITAFLDVYLAGDTTRKPYLAVPVVTSDDGTWPAPSGTPWGAYSPGGDGVTLWKGFQRGHAKGLELLHKTAEAAK